MSTASQEELNAAIRAKDEPRVREILKTNPAAARSNPRIYPSPVLLATYYGHKSIRQLILAHASELSAFEAAAVGDLKALRERLREQPGLVNAFAPDGFTPLGLASFFGHSNLVIFLLDLGAQVNVPSRNSQQVMPLHSAVAGGHLPTAQALIAHGADVNARQQDGFTPLLAAAQNGQADMAWLLLEHGADPNATSNNFDSPLAMARRSGHYEVAQLLRSYGARG